MNQRSRILALAAVLLSTAIPIRASALPGQTIAQFTAWAARQPSLRGMTRTKDEMSGWPSFTLLTADHGIGWRVDVHTDNKTIVDESLGVSTTGGEPGTAPVRHDGTGYGFTFFRNVYGAAVAGDFLSAPLAASFKDAASRTVSTFYRGKKYGYSLAAGFVTVETFLAFDREIARMRRCTAKPETCSE